MGPSGSSRVPSPHFPQGREPRSRQRWEGGRTRTAARPGCPQEGRRSPPAAAAASTESARRPGWSSVACAAAAGFSGASLPAPVRGRAVSGGRGRHRPLLAPGQGVGAPGSALTTRYCCSVWASRCSQASSDAFFCCSVVSRDMRSWGPSWESWENWAGEEAKSVRPEPRLPRGLPDPRWHPQNPCARPAPGVGGDSLPGPHGAGGAVLSWGLPWDCEGRGTVLGVLRYLQPPHGGAVGRWVR